MTTHIMSMTYGPKIEAVKRLECRQTTRVFNKDNPFKVDDYALIHGWVGLPYRTPWSWRLPKMPIIKAIDMYAFKNTVGFWQHPLTGLPYSDQSCEINYYSWQDPIINELSRLDGIVPATGLEYQHALEKFHGEFTDEPVKMQVIRW